MYNVMVVSSEKRKKSTNFVVVNDEWDEGLSNIESTNLLSRLRFYTRLSAKKGLYGLTIG